jgi:ribosomal-protein-alanine N-acetyltransferase
VTGSDLTRATPADIGALVELERTCFSQPWGAAAVTDEIAAADGGSLVARDPGDGRPVACLFYREIDGEAHLFRVAVAPERRRMGLGAALVTEFIRQARARGMRAAVLEVGSANTGALGLYHGFGFQPVATRRGYYDGGREDALILRLTLRQEDT